MLTKKHENESLTVMGSFLKSKIEKNRKKTENFLKKSRDLSFFEIKTRYLSVFEKKNREQTGKPRKTEVQIKNRDFSKKNM